MEYEIGRNESVSTAVVRAVSAVDGREPRFLPPLTDVLDPDALDRFFGPQSDGEPRSGDRVSFIYDHCSITIYNGEYLTIQPLESFPRATGEREINGRDSR